MTKAIEDLKDEDLEDIEVDEDEDVEEEAPKAKTKKKPAKAEDPTFGAKELAAHIADLTGDEVNARSLRTLLRKMARDGRINREVSQDNRTRYSWDGPNDPEVKKIIKAYQKGELAAEKKAALDKLKASKSKKDEDADDDD